MTIRTEENLICGSSVPGVREPIRSRPYMPGYGTLPAEQGTELPPWPCDRLWFSSANGSRKARNLADESRCVLSTEDPLDPVVVAGRAAHVINRGALARMLAAVNAKYGTDCGMEMLDPASSSVFALEPEWVFALDSKDFTGSPTRFTFGPTRLTTPSAGRHDDPR